MPDTLRTARGYSAGFRIGEGSFQSYFAGTRYPHAYAARHEHVAEMVFDRVLAEPEARYDQLIRILGGMNLDYSSDRRAFGQMVRGHSISDALRSRELVRAFF